MRRCPLRGVGKLLFDQIQLRLARGVSGLPVLDFFVDSARLLEVSGGSLEGELFLRRVQFGFGVTNLALKGLPLFRQVFRIGEEGGGFVVAA